MFKLPKNRYEKHAIESQRKWIEERAGNTTKLLTPNDPSQYRGLTENIIGEMSLPISIAGPLKIIGSTI